MVQIFNNIDVTFPTEGDFAFFEQKLETEEDFVAYWNSFYQKYYKSESSERVTTNFAFLPVGDKTNLLTFLVEQLINGGKFDKYYEKLSTEATDFQKDLSAQGMNLVSFNKNPDAEKIRKFKFETQQQRLELKI